MLQVESPAVLQLPVAPEDKVGGIWRNFMGLQRHHTVVHHAQHAATEGADPHRCAGHHRATHGRAVFSCRHDGESAVLADRATPGNGCTSIHFQIAALECPEEDIISHADQWLSGGRITDFLQRILALSIPGRQCVGLAARKPGVLHPIPVGTCIVFVVPEEVAMAGSTVCRHLQPPEDFADLVSRPEALCCPSTVAKCQAPFADYCRKATELLQLALDTSQGLRQRLPVPPNPEAMVVVEVEAHVGVLALFVPRFSELSR
mmetsp:Transcript_58385/g.126299  ORF Transcript_58385/g.126299 Transcript_58385/m.126299 type:complete len:261 (-) Transcript_58385:733-1515(-)